MTEQIKELALTLAKLVYPHHELLPKEFFERLTDDFNIDRWADDLCCERGISTDFYETYVNCVPSTNPCSFTEFFKWHPSRREAVTVARLKALIKSYEVEK